MRRLFGALAMLGALSAAPAQSAEWQGRIYFGDTFTHDAYIHYDPPGATGDTTILTEWDGKGFTAPFYYGLRITRWFEFDPNWGVQFDFNHIKTYGNIDAGTAAGATFDVLEFTDGLNIATVDGVYRWQNFYNRFTPYVGAGLGVNVPHVEISLQGDPAEIREYQVGGYAAVAFAGAEYRIWKGLSVFGEYKLSFAHVEPDVGDLGIDAFKVDLLNHHINVGLAYSFESF